MIERCVGRVHGVVQGVGFRPFVARLANALSLGGHVRNVADQVDIAVEGRRVALDRFRHQLLDELPAAARVDGIDWHESAPVGEEQFRIVDSRLPVRAVGVHVSNASRLTLSNQEADVVETPGLAIPPDLAVCDDCLAEVSDPSLPRYEYPFTNCTHCGPRFTIAEQLPYDRERTSMAPFAMCANCRGEYGDQRDRRYHAQAIACADCGPVLRMLMPSGSAVATGPEALEIAVTALRRGEIVAIKGLGGFQLLVRADDDRAVRRLRQRKRRPTKPLALLVENLETARTLARIDSDDVRALRHPAAPIVLLSAYPAAVAPAVAPKQPRLGIMLPVSPLHALIARGVGPLVCTSGNIHDQPICIRTSDALRQLGAVADSFLTHDRRIVRRADDSVVHVVSGRMRALRAARGLAPLSLPLEGADVPILALGGHLKHAAMFAANQRAVVWPQVGDLHTPSARDAMVAAIEDLEAFIGVRAPLVATDLHPDYATTMWACASGREVVQVQHHHAHVASVLAEHRQNAALGFAWDGVGLGADAMAWGGETLAVDRRGARRVAHLRPFPLPGGDAAARDGRRVLAGLCVAGGFKAPTNDPDLPRFIKVARSPRLAVSTTSIGRLFDGVAALTEVLTGSTFEGEAALALEAIAEPGAPPYRFDIADGVIDWRPMLVAMLKERGDAIRVASRFHATLAEMVCRIARMRDAAVVALAGGCFHNQLLLRTSIAGLREDGRRALVAECMPAGDGGLALGQAWVASSGGQLCV